jgi:hypothetical protein
MKAKIENTTDLPKAHIKELTQAGIGVYRAFDLLDGIREENGEKEIRQAVFGVVEIVRSHDLRVMPGLVRNIQALVARDASERPRLFDVWMKAVEAATPNRKLLVDTITNYHSWVAGIPRAFSDQFLELVLATVKKGYRSPGTALAGVREFLKAASIHEQSAWYLDPAKKNLTGLTQETMELLEAAGKIALAEPTVLDDLDKLCLVDALAGHKKCRAFIAALGAAVEELPSELRCPYVRLCLQVGDQSLVMGTQIAAHAYKSMEKIEQVDRKIYLRMVERIAGSAGGRLLRFLLSRLPSLLATANREALNRFLDGVCEISEKGDAQYTESEPESPVDLARKNRDLKEYVENLGTGLEGLTSELHEAYVRLCVLIGERSVSSAAYAAARVPRQLGAIPQADRAYCLHTFERIVGSVGICMIGFSLRRLPHLVMTANRDALNRFIDTACDVAARYGWRAAADFMERKTATSKSLWPVSKSS